MKKRVLSFDRLVKKRVKRVRRVMSLLLNNVIRGSIRIQGNICGTAGCRCKRKKDPIYHGPYPYLSYRGRKKNHSILLTKNKDIYAEKAIRNYKALMNIIVELSDIDFEVLRYHSHRLKKEKDL